MSTDREIIVVGDSGACRLAAAKMAIREALCEMYGIDEFAMSAYPPKELIEYKAPLIEATQIVYNPKEKPKRKGKTPRKKQNGYF